MSWWFETLLRLLWHHYNGNRTKYGLIAWTRGQQISTGLCNGGHDDVIKWKHFPRYWPKWILQTLDISWSKITQCWTQYERKKAKTSSRPRPPLPYKIYTSSYLPSRRKGQIFKDRREIKKKGKIFRHKSAKIWKRVNILHVSACFHPGFHTLNLGRVSKYSFQIRHNEKYDVRRKHAWYN